MVTGNKTKSCASGSRTITTVSTPHRSPAPSPLRPEAAIDLTLAEEPSLQEQAGRNKSSKVIVAGTTPQIQQIPEMTSNGIKCVICQDVAKVPFAARCGHIACDECWLHWLQQKLECPVCRIKVRQKLLTKLFI